MIATVNLSVPDVVDSETERTVTGVLKCPSCGSKEQKLFVVDSFTGETICQKCGAILEINNINQNHEWSAFNIEEFNDKARTGTPSSLARHDMGLFTVIGRTDKDASGGKIDPLVRSTMERLKIWDFRSQIHTPTDRNLRQAFSELDVLKAKLGLSDAIIEKTAYVYRKAQERQLVRGRTTSAILAACIYIACREIGTPRTLKDLSAISNVKRKDLARCYRLIVSKLELKIPVLDPTKCIARVANKANLSEITKRKAIDLMYKINEHELTAGKDPMGLAASVIYLSSMNKERDSNEYRTQSSLAAAAGVTEVTIRNRTQELRKISCPKII
jgi:transcription initiation factor TFIIB